MTLARDERGRSLPLDRDISDPLERVPTGAAKSAAPAFVGLGSNGLGTTQSGATFELREIQWGRWIRAVHRPPCALPVAAEEVIE